MTKFGVPRSPSPSPERRYPKSRHVQRRRSGSAFGLPPDSSDEEEYDYEESETESITSTSSVTTDSLDYMLESEIPPPSPKPTRPAMSRAELYHKEDTIASIRLRVRYKDAYEDWQRQTRRESFLAARHAQTRFAQRSRQSRLQFRNQEITRIVSEHEMEAREIEAKLASLQLAEEREEDQLRYEWHERDKEMWRRIEHIIEYEEAKERIRLEIEEEKRQEEEKKRREEELKRWLAEEKKREEEKRKKREEEERQKDLARQEEERRQLAERLKAEEEQRQLIGFTTAEDDWIVARSILKRLKNGPMKRVKADKDMKSRWNATRRLLIPKIGQVTHEARVIVKASDEIYKLLVNREDPHPKDVYIALLGSLAKIILLQAETEVTAEKKAAYPLGQLAANLIYSLEHFSLIFWARLCQRVGGWPVPIAVPSKDTDGREFGEEEKHKVEGWLVIEGAKETPSLHFSRVGAIMRMYFHILSAETAGPVHPLFKPRKYWTWFARMLQDPGLLEMPMAPEAVYHALEIGGDRAKEAWGKQWIKMLEILYEAVTVGFYGDPKRLVGSDDPDGTAARMRVQLEIERIMGMGPVAAAAPSTSTS